MGRLIPLAEAGISPAGSVRLILTPVVHEQIRQNRADHTTLRGYRGFVQTVSHVPFHRRRQPSFDVEQRPLARHVFADSPEQKFMVDVVEQSFDVELYNPVIFPASLARDADGIERRFPRPIPVGVSVGLRTIPRDLLKL